jgi:hypothetical protein
MRSRLLALAVLAAKLVAAALLFATLGIWGSRRPGPDAPLFPTPTPGGGR